MFTMEGQNDARGKKATQKNKISPRRKKYKKTPALVNDPSFPSPNFK